MGDERRIGPYRVVRELGRGGMGVVYDVRHPEIPRPLALKLLPAARFDPEDLLRFAREARLLAKVRHPGVVRIHACDRTPQGDAYLVTELVAGEPLDRCAPLPPRRAAAVVSDLAAAVAALHAAGVLHRDLKPANALLGPDDRVTLLDFGLARELDGERLTRTGDVLGTPAYMAPEQVRGAAAVDERADVYGLGAVLFHLLAGRAPFAGPGVPALLRGVLEEEPEWPEAPPALLRVLRAAMAKDPAERPASAATLGDALEACLAGRGGSGPDRRGLALAGAGLVLAGVAAAVAASAALEPGPETTPPRATPVRADERPAAERSPPATAPARPDGRPDGERPASERSSHPRPPALIALLEDVRPGPARAAVRHEGAHVPGESRWYLDGLGLIVGGEPRLVTAAMVRDEVALWDPRAPRVSLSTARSVPAVAAVDRLPGRPEILAGGDRLWRLPLTGDGLGAPEAIPGLDGLRGIVDLAVCPDEPLLAVVWLTDGASGVAVVDVEAGACLWEDDLEAPPNAVAIGPGGRHVAVGLGAGLSEGGWRGVRLYARSTPGGWSPSRPRATGALVDGVAIDPGGRLLAVGTNLQQLLLFDLGLEEPLAGEPRRAIARGEGAARVAHGAPVSDVVFVARAGTLYVVGAAGDRAEPRRGPAVAAWRLPADGGEPEEVARRDVEHAVVGLSLAADGRTLVVARLDGVFELWDAWELLPR